MYLLDCHSKPPECRSANYNLLTDIERLFSSTTASSLNDEMLVEGWYRFNINGKQMKAGFPDLSQNLLLKVNITINTVITRMITVATEILIDISSISLKDTFHLCGAQISEDSLLFQTSTLYTLKQVHAKEEDGKKYIHVNLYHLYLSPV